uniref:Small ribosomal subunit protein uS17 N-terminal domain-containing protein n=1 Tax=Oryza rufipogon TaxID=4529 RepID=A0A0E0Q9Y9_ORYRU
MAEQTEKAFLKQPKVFLSSKKSGKGKKPGKGGNRFWKSIGLGFKTPREAIEVLAGLFINGLDIFAARRGGCGRWNPVESGRGATRAPSSDPRRALPRCVAPFRPRPRARASVVCAPAAINALRRLRRSSAPAPPADSSAAAATALEAKSRPFDTITVSDKVSSKVSKRSANRVGFLPHGIVEPYSDMELKPLWLTRSAQSKDSSQKDRCLLAIPAGIDQKRSVDAIMKKNFTVMLFHYDGNVDGWNDLPWSKSVIHIAASNQTKWWFAKRFLHPSVVSMYEYIFLWDEDLEVDNFHPRRYLNIVKSEGLEISQPGLDPKLSEIHHRITVRKKGWSFHRWVEGMAPVFSRSAWRCAWHLIQNDLIHGWGIDYKFGYCAQGDRTKNIGVVDSEYIVHRGVQTLGGPSVKRSHGKNNDPLHQKTAEAQQQMRVKAGLDMRTKVRRYSRSELRDFQKRWERATREDRAWVDPFARPRRKRKRTDRQ